MASDAKPVASPLRFLVWLVVIAAAAAVVVFTMRPGGTQTPRIALITADSTEFWEGVIRGAEAAAADNGVELTIERADGTRQTQTRMLLGAADAGFDGIAISPVDGGQQGVALRKVAETTSLVTVDADSPISNRLCFVGADNYSAGRRCGELVKEALPDGARAIIVMGPIAKVNGERRRQGVIDELLDRSFGPGRPIEPLEGEHGAGDYVLAATLIDEIDPAAAQANVKAALEADPSINCVIGLFAYSTPSALAAIEELGRDGITVIGFDDDAATLEGLSEGTVYATLAQDQFSYGYDAVRLLALIAAGNTQSIPVTETIHFPPIVVTSETVGTFEAERR